MRPWKRMFAALLCVVLFAIVFQPLPDPVQALPAQLVSISVTKGPDRTEYIEGIEPDTTGMELTLTYDDGSSEVITGGWTETYDYSRSGQCRITIAYGGLTTVYTMNAAEKTPVRIAVTQLPRKTQYLEGESLDIIGLVVTAYYDDRSSETVSGYQVTGYTSTPGTKTITVTYKGLTDTFTVTVEAKKVTSIAMRSEPIKMTYLTGEALDLTGAQITVRYDNNTSEVLTVTESMVRGYNANTVGRQTITVTYGGKTTTFSVTVNARTTPSVSASASLSGPSGARAGDTIIVSFLLNGSGIERISGALSYDRDQVVMTDWTQTIASPWRLTFNGDSFTAYDTNHTAPVNSGVTLFTAKFLIRDVPAGTNVTISCNSIVASDGNAEGTVGTRTYSFTVAETPALSSNNDLASLTVSNARISPSFSAGRTSYTANVPFEVSRLEISATAADSKATVRISNPNLTPNGRTNVRVTVTAENGEEKTYTIAVTRAQDPNSTLSGNNKLSDLVVDGFDLSPAFDPDITEYEVLLPYETESISVIASAQESSASVKVIGGDELIAGEDNEVRILCTAEDGTERVYTVIAKRAGPQGEQSTDESSSTGPEESSSAESEEPESSADSASSEPSFPDPVPSGNDSVGSGEGGNGPSWPLFLFVVGLLFSAGVTVVLFRLRGRGFEEED